MRPILLLLLLSASLASQDAATLPSGYQVLRNLGRPLRWPAPALPLGLYNGDLSRQRVFLHCLQSWNQAAREHGLGNAFRPEANPDEANLVVDWSGTDLPPGKAGAVWWDGDYKQGRARKISIDGNWHVSEGVLARVLLQELGHVLGLGDSVQEGDVMYTVVVNNRRRPLPVQAVRPSERDTQALGWLYRQTAYVPLIARGRPLPSPALINPEPLFTPIVEAP